MDIDMDTFNLDEIGLGNIRYVDVESPVDSPRHYTFGRNIEPLDVIEDWGLDKDHYLANVIKYIARYGRKDNGGDAKLCLRKASFYLQRRIDR